MTSIGNKAKLVTSDICQRCSKCCKEFTMSCDINCALRFLWVDERKIKPKETPFTMPYGQGKEHQVKFKFPCTQLEFVGNKYRCKSWDKERPDFCNTYPDSIFYDCDVWNREKIQKLLDEGSEDCPAMNNITVEQVIEMLKGRKSK